MRSEGFERLAGGRSGLLREGLLQGLLPGEGSGVGAAQACRNVLAEACRKDASGGLQGRCWWWRLAGKLAQSLDMHCLEKCGLHGCIYSCEQFDWLGLCCVSTEGLPVRACGVCSALYIHVLLLALILKRDIASGCLSMMSATVHTTYAAAPPVVMCCCCDNGWAELLRWTSLLAGQELSLFYV